MSPVKDPLAVTVQRFAGRRSPYAVENRTVAGVSAGDEVEVVPREVVVPAGLAAALGNDATARTFVDQPFYTHRKEWARWVEGRQDRDPHRTHQDDLSLGCQRPYTLTRSHPCRSRIGGTGGPINAVLRNTSAGMGRCQELVVAPVQSALRLDTISTRCWVPPTGPGIAVLRRTS